MATATQYIKETGLRLVQEYQAVVRVYEDNMGIVFMEVHEKETGKCITTHQHDVIECLPRNRDQPAERIEMLEIAEKKDGLRTLHRYREVLGKQLEDEKKARAREQKKNEKLLRARKQAIEQNNKKVEELRAKGLVVATKGE